MSKFFRSVDSSDDEESSSDELDQDHEYADGVLAQDMAQIDLTSSTHESIGVRQQDQVAPNMLGSGQDWLLHSLLEERCLNQVRGEEHGQGPLSEREIQREGRRRYQLLCSSLAPLNLVSVGLDDDRHAANRQMVRDRLDSAQLNSSTTNALQRINRSQRHSPGGSPSVVPAPLRRLLTDSAYDYPSPNSWHGNGYGSEPGSPLALLSSMGSGHSPPTPARYASDFEELGILGRGGYGEVFHVKHRLDGRAYAVKKVPIRPHMVARIASEGESAMEEILAEVRSLSRLDHPNVVRYFSSWIEWSTKRGLATSSNDFTTQTTDQSRSALFGADRSTGSLLHRVRTESDTVDDDGGIVFETSTNRSRSIALDEDIDIEGSAMGRSLSIRGPHLALHMQMDVYPMTLADFISPKATNTGIAPLCHCFHLDTSLRMLLAILEGVEYLHAEDIVHRDLKPANIFLKHENNPRSPRSCVDMFLCGTCRSEGKAQPVKLSVCIGDFGLVTNIAQTTEPTSRSNSAVGTEIYRPITASGKSKITPNLDIFAVGVIACELLQEFGTQMERRQTLQQLKQGSFPKGIASCAGNHASKVKDLIAAMLTDSEEIRIADLKRGLNAIIANSAVPLSSETVLRRVST